MAIDQVSTSEYIKQKQETREALREIFGIQRTGKTETIIDAQGKGHVVSDGMTFKDLEVLTFQRLKEFVHDGTDDNNVHSLFIKAVNKIEAPKEDFSKNNVSSDEIPQEPKVVSEEKIEQPQSGDKCAKCEFRTASKIAMKLHFGKFHKDYK